MKYYIDYIDKDGDLCHVWVTATSEEEAINQVEQEYWDIENIISIHK